MVSPGGRKSRPTTCIPATSPPSRTTAAKGGPIGLAIDPRPPRVRRQPLPGHPVPRSCHGENALPDKGGAPAAPGRDQTLKPMDTNHAWLAMPEEHRRTGVRVQGRSKDLGLAAQRGHRQGLDGIHQTGRRRHHAAAGPDRSVTAWPMGDRARKSTGTPTPTSRAASANSSSFATVTNWPACRKSSGTARYFTGCQETICDTWWSQRESRSFYLGARNSPGSSGSFCRCGVQVCYGPHKIANGLEQIDDQRLQEFDSYCFSCHYGIS